MSYPAMRTSVQFLTAMVFVVISAAPVLAQQWTVNSGTDNRGIDYAHMSMERGEHSLSLGCDIRNKDDSKLSFMLAVPSLPELYAEDGVEAALTLRFVMPGGGLVSKGIATYYFDGGPGDQTWMGHFLADHALLNSLAAAEEILIVNPKGETVITFPAVGTAQGVKMIRRMCQIGLI